jgi:hypothetical protein
MTSTLSTYLQISGNMTRWRNIASSEPLVKAQTAYYKQNISSIKTPKDLVNNYRLFSYAMNAFGLGDMMYAKGLIQKVLEQGTDNPKALAYTLNNPNVLALAKTFDFAAYGDAATGTEAVKTGVVDKFVQQTLESGQGTSNPGVELALYFQRNASSIKSAYNILADKKLLTVVQTTFGISEYMSYANVDTQAKLISNAVDIEDFQDPAKVKKFIQRFSALYDATNGSALQGTIVPNCILSDGTTTVGLASFSSSLLSSMQNLKLGGY